MANDLARSRFRVASRHREIEPFGLLDGLPEPVLAAARDWERQVVVEVQTGLAPDAPIGAVPRPGFDPAVTTVAQRDQAKAAELGVGRNDEAQAASVRAARAVTGSGTRTHSGSARMRCETEEAAAGWTQRW